jgi:hypothetical protein
VILLKIYSVRDARMGQAARSTTLSIPLTGSIQREGTCLLTGRGSGSAKGYGFTLR